MIIVKDGSLRPHRFLMSTVPWVNISSVENGPLYSIGRLQMRLTRYVFSRFHLRRKKTIISFWIKAKESIFMFKELVFPSAFHYQESTTKQDFSDQKWRRVEHEGPRRRSGDRTIDRRLWQSSDTRMKHYEKIQQIYDQSSNRCKINREEIIQAAKKRYKSKSLMKMTLRLNFCCRKWPYPMFIDHSTKEKGRNLNLFTTAFRFWTLLRLQPVVKSSLWCRREAAHFVKITTKSAI